MIFGSATLIESRRSFPPNKKTARRRAQTADEPPSNFRGVLFLRVVGGARRGFSGQHGPGSQGESDLLDVLGGGGKQALAGDGNKPSEAGIAMTVELFGISEGTLDGLFAALVDALAPGRQPMSIGPLTGVRPDVAYDQAGGVAARCA